LESLNPLLAWILERWFENEVSNRRAQTEKGKIGCQDESRTDEPEGSTQSKHAILEKIETEECRVQRPMELEASSRIPELEPDHSKEIWT
jgi:hypothetical protein